jgi:3-hydroxyisobutyrate dehydrogenase-like beta-hydroxyacid dehydrogenase
MAATPREASTGAEQVFVCVGNDDDVRSVVLGDDGVFAGLQPGAVVVDHTTASAELARELATRAAKEGLGFIDAPVSGGQAGAENGVLTVMAGGDAPVFEQVAPVLDCYARCARLLGANGSGQLAKMVNQVCIAGVVQGLAEAMTLSERAGLDTAAVVEVIAQGAAQSWQMENRYQTMLANEYDHGFAVDWMRKDLGMVLAEASRLNLELPVTTLVDSFYAQVQDMGGGRWDTSSLFARMLERNEEQH